MDVLTVLDVLIEPNAAEIVDGKSLVVALENIDLVPSEFSVSRYYETLEHRLSTIYQQSMLVYEECRHEESTPQVKAMERAFKRSTEGQRLNNLIREKNVDGYLPRSVGKYMNAAEDLAAEAEAALRKARRYTDAAGGKPSASRANARKRHQASSYKQKCPDCGSFDRVYKDCCYRSHPYFNTDPSIEYAQSPVGIRYHNTFGGRYIKERDLDPTLPKNDRGASMQRKRSRMDDSAGLSGKYLGAEIPPYTVAAILQSELTLPCISRHINEIVGSVSQIQTLAVKSFTSSDGRQGALAITAVTMPKIGIAARTTARTRIGIGTRELDAIRGVVAETLHRIVEATPGTRTKTTGSARQIRGTRKKVTTLEIGVASLLLIQRGIDQTTVSVLKLMMIIPVYAHFSMLRR